MDKMIRRKELLDLIGVSSTTQWRLEKAGQFPARVKLGEGSVGWHQVEVEKWIENRQRLGHMTEPEAAKQEVGKLGADGTLTMPLMNGQPEGQNR